ncbi:CBN-ZIG-1 protein [Caenorhabditis brenneri]|uniref:CBN-ZIG-1 protein n=1 Tax=Caenorhabditis brenneri TaxID=135651 RepID=G0MFM7_CAEBE|nr:CBN-ZIG-1 protein [Caenorhabditis brenneri]
MKNLLLITFVLVGSVSALGGRGSKHALALVAARSSELHPLHATDPITIWCAPDNPQVTIKSAHFVKLPETTKLEATLNPTKKNATYTFGSPSVKDAGEYRCELDTSYGKISHAIFIYSRPVVHSHEHFTEHEGHEYHLESTGTTVEKGEVVTLTCPVFGYPKPVPYKFISLLLTSMLPARTASCLFLAKKFLRSDNTIFFRLSKKFQMILLRPLVNCTVFHSQNNFLLTKNRTFPALSKSVTMEGTTIIVSSANYTDGGTYSCEAVNEYTLNGKTSKMLLVVDKMVNVKSEFQWVYPLAVIIITLLLLVLIIVVCEWRLNLLLIFIPIISLLLMFIFPRPNFRMPFLSVSTQTKLLKEEAYTLKHAQTCLLQLVKTLNERQRVEGKRRRGGRQAIVRPTELSRHGGQPVPKEAEKEKRKRQHIHTDQTHGNSSFTFWYSLPLTDWPPLRHNNDSFI